MTETVQGELTYLMGGEIDRGFFMLQVSGDNLNPDAITSLLKTQPTKAHRKGDLSKNGKFTHRTGLWSLESGELDFRSTDKNCEDFLADWVAKLPDDTGAWTAIQKEYKTEVRIALYMKTWNREFAILPSTLQELARRGLMLHIDTYFCPDETESNQASEATSEHVPSADSSSPQG